MAFYSILFPTPEDETRAKAHPWLTFRADDKKCEKYTVRGNKIVLATKENRPDAPMRPGLYLDLNFDQIMDAVLCHETDGELAELFFHFCPDTAMVLYRQEVMKALEEIQVHGAFQTFLQSMAKAGRLLSYGRQAHPMRQRDKYALDGAALYCTAIRRLLHQTSELSIQSQGLLCFLNAVKAHVEEASFAQMEERIQQAKSALERIAYGLRVNDGVLYVDFDADAADYVQALDNDFKLRTRWGAEAEENRREIALFRQVELSPLETLILKALEEKHPRAFDEARVAAEMASGLPEPFIARFIKEVRFYFLYLDLMNQLRGNGCTFAYPTIAGTGEVSLSGAYDLALAIKTNEVVPNDFILSAGESGAVITGANQGGKTTFARSIGQIAILAALGLPVPCQSASLPLYSAAFSQFTLAEDATVDNGKLKEELLRLKPILKGAGKGSLVILNELFSSATAQDALDMADSTLKLLIKAGAHVVCVTHIEGLAVKQTVSMVAQVRKANGQRLYKIIRAAPDGQAYANEIALRHHLTFKEIKERVENGV